MSEVKSNKAEMAYKTIVRKDPITNKPVNCALVESGRKVSISQILRRCPATATESAKPRRSWASTSQSCQLPLSTSSLVTV